MKKLGLLAVSSFAMIAATPAFAQDPQADDGTSGEEPLIFTVTPRAMDVKAIPLGC